MTVHKKYKPINKHYVSRGKIIYFGATFLAIITTLVVFLIVKFYSGSKNDISAQTLPDKVTESSSHGQDEGLTEKDEGDTKKLAGLSEEEIMMITQLEGFIEDFGTMNYDKHLEIIKGVIEEYVKDEISPWRNLIGLIYSCIEQGENIISANYQDYNLPCECVLCYLNILKNHDEYINQMKFDNENSKQVSFGSAVYQLQLLPHLLEMNFHLITINGAYLKLKQELIRDTKLKDVLERYISYIVQEYNSLFKDPKETMTLEDDIFSTGVYSEKLEDNQMHYLPVSDDSGIYKFLTMHFMSLYILIFKFNDERTEAQLRVPILGVGKLTGKKYSVSDDFGRKVEGEMIQVDHLKYCEELYEVFLNEKFESKILEFKRSVFLSCSIEIENMLQR